MALTDEDKEYLGSRPKDTGNGTAAFSNIAIQGIETFGDILKELIRASMSNPMMGILVSLIVIDVLENNKILRNDSVDSNGVGHSSTALMMKGIIVAAAGVSVAGEIIQTIGDIVPLAQGSRSPASLLQPSGQVLVFNDKNNEQLNALLQKKVS